MAIVYEAKQHPLVKRVLELEKRTKELEAQKKDTDTRLEGVESVVNSLINATEVAL
jgi:chaperonin cofactor prefoldin